MSPPRIIFDDGSRIIMQDATTPSNHDNQRTSNPSARGAVPVRVYYEIDRVARDVVDKLDWSEMTSRGRLLREISSLCRRDDSDNGEAPHDGMDDVKVANNANERRVVGATNTNSNDEEDDGFLCRIALQFPDDLLSDAPTVSWLLEDSIAIAYNEKLMESSLVTEATASAVKRLNQLALDDSPDAQLLIEEHLAHRHPLVFILGDASPSCCPDEVSANHLNANVIVHYGYACLAPTESVPVVYAFGVSRGAPDGGDAYDESGDVTVWKECVQLVSNECHGKVQAGEILLAQSMSMENSHEKKHRKLLLLYEVRYHHAMNSLKLEFEKAGEQFQVVLGSIPKQQLTVARFEPRKREGCGSDGDCGGGGCVSNACAATVSNDVHRAIKGQCDSTSECEQQSSQSCCGKDASSCCTEPNTANCGIPNTTANDTEIIDQQHDLDKQYIPRTIGGIEIPDDLDLRQYTLLYIGDDMDIDSHEGNECTRLLLILLRCNAPDGPKFIFSYSPITRRLNADVLNSPMSLTNVTTPSTVLSRLLRRRYFLLNKAKLATTIAILIGTSSQSYSFRRLLSLTRHRIQSTGRTAYTFSVGKLSTAGHKLSNFAEIDCYVLIACGESIAKFWKMEREAMCVPVLTPLELDVALGFREWDGRYSCDFGDLIRWNEADGIVAKDEFHGGDHVSAFYGNHKEMLRLNKAVKCDDDESNRSNYNADEPFFSMISGKYEQSKSVDTSNQNAITSCSSINHLVALPGQGKIIEYRSEAAEFLKKREYRGLEAKVGETEVKAAVLGMVGIASDYGENP
jgi:diphthamide synthase subunit DPH2